MTQEHWRSVFNVINTTDTAPQKTGMLILTFKKKLRIQIWRQNVNMHAK